MHAINGLSEALRAQEHEYANRLFVIAGLMETGDYDQVNAYLSQLSRTHSSVGEDLRSRIESPELAALLRAKATIAAEHGVHLTLSEDSRLDQPQLDPQVLLTIVGNLVDNAIDAVLDQHEPGEVTVRLWNEDGVHIIVSDNGSGVPLDRVNDVFLDGYSTKNPRSGGMRRGLGLALVSRIVRRYGGTITVTPGPGGYFEAYLPTQDLTGGPHHPTTKLEHQE